MAEALRLTRAAARPLAAPASLAAVEAVWLSAAEAAAEIPAWQALADTAIEPNPFFRPQFLQPYLDHLAPASVGVAVARRRRDGAFLALAPAGRRRLGLLLPAAHVWTHEFAPLGTPLVAPDATEAALAALLETIAARFGGPVVCPLQRSDGPVASMLAAAARAHGYRCAGLARHERPALAADEGPEAFEAGLSGQRRRRLARQARKLDRLGQVRRERLEGPAVEAGFAAFLSLEQAGWKGEAGTALATAPARVAFARQAVAGLAAHGHAVVDLITLDDAPVAALVSLRDGPRAFAWKIAFDEAHARLSPGVQILLDASTRSVAEPGLREVDSLAAPGPCVADDLWSARIPFETLLLAEGARARPLLAAAKADLAARAAARRLRARLRAHSGGL